MLVLPCVCVWRVIRRLWPSLLRSFIINFFRWAVRSGAGILGFLYSPFIIFLYNTRWTKCFIYAKRQSRQSKAFFFYSSLPHLIAMGSVLRNWGHSCRKTSTFFLYQIECFFGTETLQRLNSCKFSLAIHIHTHTKMHVGYIIIVIQISNLFGVGGGCGPIFYL